MEWSTTHIPREVNVETDALANLGSSTEMKGYDSGTVVQLMHSAKSTNKVIIQNLKKRLEVAKGKWPEELPGVLWVYRMTAKSSTRETPFSLIHGAEALIPVEVGEPTLRFFRIDEEANNEALLVKLELLDECRDLA
uniref:RNase H type-1 domain-containing protein n=1 Tax=Nicotiana tabacum TaxID=4097 RepID=A0A1S3ZU74_TOBAC|nr:PREDICTED: uncharacterized protein LOC107790544 [Nicotiana tabacum]